MSSDTQRWRFWQHSRQYGQRRLFGGFTWSLGMVGLVAVVAFALLIVSNNGTASVFDADMRQIQSINALMQQARAMRIQTTHFLVTQQAADFEASKAAIGQLLAAYDRTIADSNGETRFILEGAKDSTLNYTNTYQSLGALILTAHAPASQPTISLSLDENGAQLDRQTDNIVAQSTASQNESEQLMRDDSSRLCQILLAVIIVTFSVSLVWQLRAARRLTEELQRMGQAANTLADGQFNFPVVPSRDDEIGRLGAALSRAAERLKSSTQTESAASEQNRHQIMKLARQERVNAILEERQRIARELHDSVKQQLFSITLASGAALNIMSHKPDLARSYLEQIQQAGLYAQAEMTTLLQELIPVPLQDQRLEDAVAKYLHLMCDIHSIKLLWRVEGTNTLTISQEHSLFRVIQEATANVARHSQATLLRVTVSFGLQTRVIIEDNGQGFDPETVSPTSRGLATMRLRLKRVGGELRLYSLLGSGTRLEITVDLRRQVPYERQ